MNKKENFVDFSRKLNIMRVYIVTLVIIQGILGLSNFQLGIAKVSVVRLQLLKRHTDIIYFHSGY